MSTIILHGVKFATPPAAGNQLVTVRYRLRSLADEDENYVIVGEFTINPFGLFVAVDNSLQPVVIDDLLPNTYYVVEVITASCGTYRKTFYTFQPTTTTAPPGTTTSSTTTTTSTTTVPPTTSTTTVPPTTTTTTVPPTTTSTTTAPPTTTTTTGTTTAPPHPVNVDIFAAAKGSNLNQTVLLRYSVNGGASWNDIGFGQYIQGADLGEATYVARIVVMSGSTLRIGVVKLSGGIDIQHGDMELSQFDTACGMISGTSVGVVTSAKTDYYRWINTNGAGAPVNC